MRRIVRRAGTLCAVIALCAIASAPHARADNSRQGWWTATNPGGMPPTVTGPDVPTGDLLVQGGASDSSPAAYAALIRAVPADAIAATLTLHLEAKGANRTGALKVCPLTVEDFTPAEGGPMAQAPPYDCANAVFAAIGADGATYSFDVAKLVSAGSLAVAVLANSADVRVVIQKPGSDALNSTTPSATPAAASVEDMNPAAPAPLSDIPVSPGAASPVTSGTSSAATDTPVATPFLTTSTSTEAGPRPVLVLLAVVASSLAWLAWTRPSLRLLRLNRRTN